MGKYCKYVFIILSFASIILVALGCAASNRASQSVAPAIPQAPAPASAPAGKTADMAYSSGWTANTETPTTSPDDRKIVKTGSINMDVSDISKSIDDIAAIAQQYNGFVVSSNQRADIEEPRGYISIRVPSTKFTDSLQAIKDIASKVTYETTNSQDVTEQYTDLQAQLHNLEATEAQYLELLKKAEKVTDILEVQRELSNVRNNIERTKGRIQYLDRTTDMSLIEVNLRKSKPIGQSSWDITGIFKAAIDGLIVFSKILLGILIWILVFSPIWIIALIIVFAVRRRRKNKSNPTN